MIAKHLNRRYAAPKGVTLIELTVVILVLMAMVGGSLVYMRGMDDWKLGKDASEKLKTVYAAQKAYLADHPTAPVSSLTAAMLIPYLPTGETALPTVKSKEGGTLNIKVNVSPPVVDKGDGTAYDPSGKTNDNLWDVGL